MEEMKIIKQDTKKWLLNILDPANTFSLGKLLEVIAQRIAERTHGEDCTIYLLKDKENKLVLSAATRPVFAELIGEEEAEYKPNEGLTGWVFQKKESLKIKDVHNKNELRQISPDLVWRDKLGTFTRFPVRNRSILVAPIHTKESAGAIGVILVTVATDSEFSDKDKICLEEDAINLAYLLEEMDLYRNNNSWVANLKIGSTRSKDKLLEHIVNEAAHIIGVGALCSIFFLDKQTTKYFLKKSTHKEFEDEYKKQNLSYGVGEGKTGWVAKNNKTLKIDDLDDKILLERYGLLSESTKREICETISQFGEQAKSFLAVPIRNINNKNEVIGIIRVPSTKKNAFTDEHTILLERFADQLSPIIEESRIFEARNELVDTFLEMAQIQDLKLLYQRMADEGKLLVDAGGCSVFIKSKSDPECFELKGTTSPPSSPIDEIAVKSGRGLTGYVVQTGKTLCLRNAEDEKELDEIEKGLRRLGEYCEVKRVGPFLAVPVKTTNTLTGKEDVIGVVRAPREYEKIDTQEFYTEADKHLFQFFARYLSLVISRVKREADDRIRIKQFEKSEKERRENFENIFSKCLLEKCRDISELSYTPQIQKFLSHYPSSGDLKSGMDKVKIKSPIEAVLDSISSLWQIDEMEKYNCNLFNELKNIEVLLKEIPHYRDHFMHQFQVFLLGCCIIDKMYKFKKTKNFSTFSDLYFKSIENTLSGNQKFSEDEKRKIAETAWLIASTTHDLCYPLERFDDWIGIFISTFFSTEKKLVGDIELTKLAGEALPYIDRWAEFCGQSMKIGSDLVNSLKSKFLDKMGERDHGVLGALSILSKNVMNNEIILPASIAIASHKKMLSDFPDITFEDSPLVFLLNYCDMVHEWGRCKDVGFEEELRLLEKLEISPKNIRTEIKLGDRKKAKNKLEELRGCFSKLRSSKPIFCIYIKDIPDGVDSTFSGRQ
ncbi:MAG: GAF domain-containing protein [Methanocellales archaeon]|nr:GAF domain-containing protein [Methanocellales archaeon]MDD3291322.1 GAF domain-containing protein [Methanocellales archaeon]MDD5235816.1 GAF domain-containing protein [Methanocellales archaeon]MDD5484423.1 GAF domain-containing protein [Methanocellales archaeon]